MDPGVDFLLRIRREGASEALCFDLPSGCWCRDEGDQLFRPCGMAPTEEDMAVERAVLPVLTPHRPGEGVAMRSGEALKPVRLGIPEVCDMLLHASWRTRSRPRAARRPLEAAHAWPIRPLSRCFSFPLSGGFGADFSEACFDEGEIETRADLAQATAEGLAGQGGHFHRRITVLGRSAGAEPGPKPRCVCADLDDALRAHKGSTRGSPPRNGQVACRTCPPHPSRRSYAEFLRAAPGAPPARGGVLGAEGARRRSRRRSRET